MMSKKDNPNLFSYELSKIKYVFKKVYFTALMVQLLSFIFFALVGKFDNGSDTIFTFSGIIALSHTITMCLLAIYGSVILRKELVRFYIGEQRHRIFLFPVDRKDLIVKKTNALLLMIVAGLFFSLLSALILEVLATVVLKFEETNFLQNSVMGIVAISVSCFMIYVILLASEMVAIWRQSEIATVVTAIILMLSFSNVTAMGMIIFPFITLLSVALMAVGLSIAFVRFAAYIKQMEVY